MSFSRGASRHPESLTRLATSSGAPQCSQLVAADAFCPWHHWHSIRWYSVVVIALPASLCGAQRSDDWWAASPSAAAGAKSIGEGLGADEAALVGGDDGLNPVSQTELHQNAGDVRLGGAFADE